MMNVHVFLVMSFSYIAVDSGWGCLLTCLIYTFVAKANDMQRKGKPWQDRPDYPLHILKFFVYSVLGHYRIIDVIRLSHASRSFDCCYLR